MQQEMEAQKDGHAAELAQQRRGMENVIIKLKEDETSLRDRLDELHHVSTVYHRTSVGALQRLLVRVGQRLRSKF